MRLPSKGIGAREGSMRGSAMIFSQAPSRTAFDLVWRQRRCLRPRRWIRAPTPTSLGSLAESQPASRECGCSPHSCRAAQRADQTRLCVRPMQHRARDLSFGSFSDQTDCTCLAKLFKIACQPSRCCSMEWLDSESKVTRTVTPFSLGMKSTTPTRSPKEYSISL